MQSYHTGVRILKITKSYTIISLGVTIHKIIESYTIISLYDL